MQGNNNQLLTQDERTVIRRLYVRLRFCDVCGSQLFNDGHEVNVVNMDQPSYTLCDDCYDSWVRTTKA